MSYTDYNSSLFTGSNYTKVNTSTSSANSMSSPYTSMSGSIFDTDAGYQSVIDDYHAKIAELQSKQAEEEKKAAEEKKKAQEEQGTEKQDGSNGTSGATGANGVDKTDNADKDEDVDGSEDVDGENTEVDGQEDVKEEQEQNPEAENEEEPIEYSDEQLILIHDTAENILDATVRVKTGPFALGTDEKAFIKALKDPDVTPEILAGVQAELQAQGHDLFSLIRDETSWGTEDVLEGYALAKLGGTSKETNTKLESYYRYQDMDKNSVEYQNYIRTCVSLFKESTNGWGTDEKVLAYVLSLPDDILSDVKEKYGKGFDETAKGDISGVLKEEYYG